MASTASSSRSDRWRPWAGAPSSCSATPCATPQCAPRRSPRRRSSPPTASSPCTKRCIRKSSVTPEVLAKAALLGLIEGVTEFIPVSSTGHLILASAWLGETDEAAKTFDIFIQLGAILAIVWLYRERLLRAVID